MVELPCPQCEATHDLDPPDSLDCDCGASYWIPEGRPLNPHWPPSLAEVGFFVAVSVAIGGGMAMWNGYSPVEGLMLSVAAFLFVMWSMSFGPM